MQTHSHGKKKSLNRRLVSCGKLVIFEISIDIKGPALVPIFFPHFDPEPPSSQKICSRDCCDKVPQPLNIYCDNQLHQTLD